MIRLTEQLDPRLRKRFYAKSHKPKEFFNEDHFTDIEKELEWWVAGGHDFTDKVKFKLKEYIDNSPTSTYPLYRVTETFNSLKGLEIGDIVIFDIKSFTKSLDYIEDYLTGKLDVDIADNPLVFVIDTPVHSINIEGYSYFSEQEEHLLYGKFKVVKTKNQNNCLWLTLKKV